MTQFNAYLSFNGNCREAMNFYKDCFGGELTIQTVGESPMAKDMPAEMQNQVMHSQLSNGTNIMLLASDLHREKLTPGNNITLCINCSSEEEINNFFSKLSEGGNVTDKLSVKFWGGTFGGLTDKFGINWIMNYSKEMHQ